MANSARPVAPMSLAEARRMITDAHFATAFDPFTRTLAWKMVHAARRGQCLAVVLITSDVPPSSPGDAA